MRRLLRDLSSVLIISGVLLIADAAVTLAWQEPVTAMVGLLRRGEIDHRLERAAARPLVGLQRRALASLPDPTAQMAFLARRELRELSVGDAVGRIEIPEIGVSYDIVQGTDELSLEKGPGHYPQTALPGMGETVAVAGHRTTYLAPFRHIDALRPGDRILMKMPYGNFTYVVQYHRIVLPDAWSVIDDVGYDRLVLSACNPLYSAAQRIIVFARLQSERPIARGAGSPAARPPAARGADGPAA
jgi:sortase A